jgi:hypothetical protein
VNHVANALISARVAELHREAKVTRTIDHAKPGGARTTRRGPCHILR